MGFTVQPNINVPFFGYRYGDCESYKDEHQAISLALSFIKHSVPSLATAKEVASGTLTRSASNEEIFRDLVQIGRSSINLKFTVGERS